MPDPEIDQKKNEQRDKDGKKSVHDIAVFFAVKTVKNRTKSADIKIFYHAFYCSLFVL
jgi:hypothetical protein